MHFNPKLVRNGFSLTGIFLATVSAVLFLAFFLSELFGLHTTPYVGIIVFLLLPGVFILGLLLIPFGLWRERRRIARGEPERSTWPIYDFSNPTLRRTAFLVAVLTVANLVIVSLAAYRGIEFMDTPKFCGEVCHDVMQPEYTAYKDGPHSRVACVRCHIGPGAGGFIKAKLNGTRQLIGVMRNNYARPVPAPVHTLSAARDVCETCHWPEKFHGERPTIKREYADDEAVTETTTSFGLKVGGGSEKLGMATGIHWHMNLANEVDYVALDSKRETIAYVRVKDRSGAVREYVTEGVTAEQLAKGERRRMDCIDCHNRPAHRFDPSPERAVDAAIASNVLPRLPFVRREAVAALKAEYPDRDTAQREIARKLDAFYKSLPGDLMTSRGEEVARAARAVQAVYARNVFPKMKVTFGTYPSHLGHMDTPGCFRCHGGEQKTKDGQTISQDCALCHTEPDIK